MFPGEVIAFWKGTQSYVRPRISGSAIQAALYGLRSVYVIQ